MPDRSPRDRSDAAAPFVALALAPSVDDRAHGGRRDVIVGDQAGLKALLVRNADSPLATSQCPRRRHTLTTVASRMSRSAHTLHVEAYR